MKVFIKNLYGIQDGKKAYYRKQGIGCFDFVNSIKFASDLTKEEAAIVAYAMNRDNWRITLDESYSGDCWIDVDHPQEIKD